MKNIHLFMMTIGLWSLLGTTSQNLIAQCSDLFISEYVDGTGDNKCIELFNPTNHDINMLGKYKINLYANGYNWSQKHLYMYQTIESMTGYVLCNEAADQDFLDRANTTEPQVNSPITWDGNDAITLTKVLEDEEITLDLFGAIGHYAGDDGWVVNGNHTKQRTLRRNNNINEGNTDNIIGFPALGTEWTEYPLNTSDGLGEHSITTNCPEVEDCSELFFSEYVVNSFYNICGRCCMNSTKK